MKKLLILALFGAIVLGCKERYREGEITGVVSKISYSGFIFTSLDGELVTENSKLNFSFDNSKDSIKYQKKMIKSILSAYNEGLKVRIKYHEPFPSFIRNMFYNRGLTGRFVDSLRIIVPNKTNKIVIKKSEIKSDTLIVKIINQ